MSIAADLIRGHTEPIILSQLIQHDSYGYEINKAIRRISGGKYELKEARRRSDRSAKAVLPHHGGRKKSARRTACGVERGGNDHTKSIGHGRGRKCVNN